jgi:hypothetical protein
MSFDIFLQRFEAGEAADGDGTAILDVLEPMMRDRSGSFARIVTGDGEAEVYGLDHPERGLMLTHASGREVWDVIFDLARVGGMVVMPVGCPTCVVDPKLVRHIPEGPPAAEVVTSGADILRLVEQA